MSRRTPPLLTGDTHAPRRIADTPSGVAVSVSLIDLCEPKGFRSNENINLSEGVRTHGNVLGEGPESGWNLDN